MVAVEWPAVEWRQWSGGAAVAQVGIQNKNVQRLLLGFVVFLVLTSPQVAGQQTRAFAGWLGDAASSLNVFIHSAFNDTPPG
jgi:hypothetical protein